MAEQAARIAFSVDYLPFGHLENGCYSRAIYLGMELADAGIPSVQQFVSGKSPFSLFPRPEQAWDWHTAPMIWVRGDAEPTILDPALAPAPLKRGAWVAKLHAKSDVHLFWGDIATLGIGTKSDETAGPSRPEVLPTSTGDLAGFRGGDLTYAARELCAYLDQEPGVAAAESGRKKRKLETRTRELLESLDKQGLVHEYEISGIKDFNCY